MAEMILSPEAQDAIDSLNGKNLEAAREIGRATKAAPFAPVARVPPRPAIEPEMRTCSRPGCGKDYQRNLRGQPRLYCSDYCKKRANQDGVSPLKNKIGPTRELNIRVVFNAVNQKIVALGELRKSLLAVFPDLAN